MASLIQINPAQAAADLRDAFRTLRGANLVAESFDANRSTLWRWCAKLVQLGYEDPRDVVIADGAVAPRAAGHGLGTPKAPRGAATPHVGRATTPRATVPMPRLTDERNPGVPLRGGRPRRAAKKN